MSRICYIFREKEKNETSIELVFDAISEEIIRSGHSVAKWYKPVSWIQTFKDIRRLRKEKFDLYHITGDVNYLWMFFPWKRTTMTIHDIGMFKNNPKTFKRRLFVFLSFILPTLFLKKITCVSELTRQDLINILNINHRKIEVIDNPVVLDIKPVHKDFCDAAPIILQIGTGPHKNLEALIEAVAELPCRVEIIGSPAGHLLERMNQLGIKYNVSNRLSNEEVIEKYRQCDILYFVSRSEGFGLPILEAQSMGRPVLTANTEPTRSVCGGGALLYAPDDVAGIREGILLLINNPSERQRLVSIGFENIKRYKRDNIASLYANFYKKYFRV